MNDTWQSHDHYEKFMGRWSRLVANQFLDWLASDPGLKWLDVGCGSGALIDAVMRKYEPTEVSAIDQSEAFVKAAQQRLGNGVHCRVGNALNLPLEDASVNITISGLVLNFIPEAENALAEMKRATHSGGTIAAYVWDYAGKMEFLQYFWDAVIELDPEASQLNEGERFPDCNPEALQHLFNEAGLVDTQTTPIRIDTNFVDFDDFWQPFLGGQGPAPSYVQSLAAPEQNRLSKLLYKRLPIQTDGSIPLSARAWAVKGEVST